MFETQNIVPHLHPSIQEILNEIQQGVDFDPRRPLKEMVKTVVTAVIAAKYSGDQATFELAAEGLLRISEQEVSTMDQTRLYIKMGMLIAYSVIEAYNVLQLHRLLPEGSMENDIIKTISFCSPSMVLCNLFCGFKYGSSREEFTNLTSPQTVFYNTFAFEMFDTPPQFTEPINRDTRGFETMLGYDLVSIIRDTLEHSARHFRFSPGYNFMFIRCGVRKMSDQENVEFAELAKDPRNFAHPIPNVKQFESWIVGPLFQNVYCETHGYYSLTRKNSSMDDAFSLSGPYPACSRILTTPQTVGRDCRLRGSRLIDHFSDLFPLMGITLQTVNSRPSNTKLEEWTRFVLNYQYEYFITLDRLDLAVMFK